MTVVSYFIVGTIVIVLFPLVYALGYTIGSRSGAWSEQTDQLWSYVFRLDSTRKKARAALAQWDDGNLSDVRQTLTDIAQLGEDNYP
jgi:hypothetical protein